MVERFIIVKVKDGIVNGLKTYYYVWSGEKPPDDLSSLKPVYETISPWINYIWWDSPAPGVPKEFFAIAWFGYLKVDRPGVYRFYVTTDDGSRFWVDGELLIDAWKDQPPTTYVSKPVFLTRGFHRLKYYFYSRYVFSEAVLGWIPQEGEASIIPKDKLYHCIGDTVFFTNLPDNYVVELLPVDSSKKKCIVSNGICGIKASYEEYPLESMVRILDDKGDIVYESQQRLLIWGGDEFKLVIVKSND